MPEPLPKENFEDDIHQGVRCALSTIPFVGGTAVEIFNRILAPPIQRRRDEWLNDLADRITKMEQEKRLDIEVLINNDEFVSTIIQASQTAVRNHQREKLEALRNAVLNTALNQAPDDTMREMFLSFIDSFTVRHLLVLKILNEGDRRGGQRSHVVTSISSITKKAIELDSKLGNEQSFIEIVVEDLCRRGLIFWNPTVGAIYIKDDVTQVTEIGRAFIRFISDPPEN